MWIIIKRKSLVILTIMALAIIISMICLLLGLRFGDYKGATAPKKGYVVLVIDDFGNNGEGTEEMLSLEIPMTAAVMPFMPYSSSEAEKAIENGFEVIMHIPMEPLKGKPHWLGPRGITTDLSEDEIKNRIRDGLDEVKGAVGMNNHMGSKVTQDKRVMNIVLQIAKEKNIYFIDSMTTDKSVGFEIARDYEVVYMKRDVFLDNIKEKDHIKGQLDELSRIALERGYAIGIGHVGPEGGSVTAQAIKEMIPKLKDRGIEFTTISNLLDIINLLE